LQARCRTVLTLVSALKQVAQHFGPQVVGALDQTTRLLKRLANTAPLSISSHTIPAPARTPVVNGRVFRTLSRGEASQIARQEAFAVALSLRTTDRILARLAPIDSQNFTPDNF
jgi:hypothetical protein